ncbi:rab-like protein 3 isoform X2 [Corticium candelabrum]|uniref:rab-like protein 3 isoform X2 n=1 Tax=Corticium candelabrum TaxID=121492 RepID=UPI002E268F48|nr:rab-like protein 3 isoform X2 [Corticium candelabrum]
MAGPLDKVKILVVGDSGVGKSCLVHLICKGDVLKQGGWTVGCTVDVLPFEYTKKGPSRNVFLELWDVGGSAAHQSARSSFYHSFHGLILVHDLTNRKSRSNLSKWLAEVLSGSKETTGSSSFPRRASKPSLVSDYDPEQFADDSVPILVVGTKEDLMGSVREGRQTSSLDASGADAINVNCMNRSQFSSGSTQERKLYSFFEKVIEKRYYPRGDPAQVCLV